MSFHDLNVVYTGEDAELSNTLSFARELGYGTMALSINITTKLPAQLPQVNKGRITIPDGLHALTRLTLTLSDPSQNHRVNSLNTSYDILALRPSNEKAFQLCCASLDCDIITIDFAQRVPFVLKFKTVAAALQRGIRFEICYSHGVTGGSDARRNLISGAAALVRATRGRGIILSSEAKNALGLRGPSDVMNLAQIWGLSQERAKESICEEASKMVRLASMKRSSFRGVVDIINNGTTLLAEAIGTKEAQETTNRTDSTVADKARSPLPELKLATVIPDKLPSAKRKASSAAIDEPSLKKSGDKKSISKRELKRQAKKARLDRANGKHENVNPARKQNSNSFSIQHESLVSNKNG